MTEKRSAGWMVAALCAALAVGCTPRKGAKKGASAGGSQAAGEAGATLPPGVEVGEADIRGTEFTDVPELESIHFDYDAYSLADDARAALQKNAEFLKKNRELEVLVAGHCDDRGTIEYNLALGQKRAKEVREYYRRLGVPGKSVATISYGEEKPTCAEATESCWRQNRRAETRVRARTASTPKAP